MSSLPFSGFAKALVDAWKAKHEEVVSENAQEEEHPESGDPMVHGHNATSHRYHTHKYGNNVTGFAANASHLMHFDLINYGKLNKENRLVKHALHMPLNLHKIPQPVRIPPTYPRSMKPMANWPAFNINYLNSTAYTRFNPVLTIETNRGHTDYTKRD